MNNEDQSIISIKNLLTQANLILEKYEGIAERTGENFNIFKILNLSTNEVRTHSAFIAELLNPKGSHGMHDIFLNIFIKQLREKFGEQYEFLERIDIFETHHAFTVLEEYIGPTDKEMATGGRIDIVIKDILRNAIIIENKIYAADQESQLIRYRKAYPMAPILYLTLLGSFPSLNSIKFERDSIQINLVHQRDFICISYKDDISRWLDECYKNSVSFPLLRETIAQYLQLIKLLTGQTMNKEISTSIASLVSDDLSKLKAAIAIFQSKDAIHQSILQTFIYSLKVRLKPEWSVEENSYFGKKNEELFINRSGWTHRIILLFNRDFSDLHIGIYRNDRLQNTNLDLRYRVIERLQQLNLGMVFTTKEDSKNYLNWLWYCQFSICNDLSLPEIFEGKMTSIVQRTIEQIDELLTGIDL